MHYMILFMLAGFELYNVNGRSLTLMGFTQAYFSYSTQNNNTFALRRSRVTFLMRQSKDLTFKMQMDFLKTPVLLDAKMTYRNRGFMLQFGRFLPDFTFYMPHSSMSLDFVYYPMLCEKYGMWRQVGMEISYSLNKNLFIRGGMYNGPVNNYRDINGTKDGLLKLGYNGKTVKAGIYTYLERPEEDLSKVMAGLYTDIRPHNVILTVEPLFIKGDSINSLGFYAQTGYYVSKSWKALIRYDLNVPDIDSTQNKESRISVSMVRSFGGHLKLYLNFIRNVETKANEAILQLQCVW